MGSPWKKIESIFIQAVQIKGRAKRSAYLDKACRNQAVLRSEVESLLVAYEKSGNFLGLYSIGGTVLSHYEILERIGEGGMGHVYKARDKRLDRFVAIKVLPSWDVADPRAGKRLIREAIHTSALSHPNIVTVYEIARAKKMDFLVMEYIPGQKLSSLIPARGFPVAKGVALALQVADALATAHAAGIFHRDLTPSNIIVAESGQAKLLDFGLARKAGDKRREDGFGTEAYMAPEQKHGITDARSDIFSFGLVLYELLCGRRPFPDAHRPERKRDGASSPRRLRPKVPVGLSVIVLRCLQRNPERRFQSVVEVVDALQTLSGNRGGRDTSLAAFTKSNEKSENLQRVRTALMRIGFQSVNDSNRAFEEIVPLLGEGASPYLRQVVASAMRRLILTVVDDSYYPVPLSIREVRRRAMELIRLATRGDFLRCFQEHDLEELDLFEMNFEAGQLAGLSFKQSFLAGASFKGSRLTRVSFAGAFIRNVNLEGANLTGADFTHSDWFNARGLTRSQLASVRRDTLLDCPATVQKMHRFLKGRYVIPFGIWPKHQQEQLRAAWTEYLRPGGLKDLVARWRTSS